MTEPSCGSGTGQLEQRLVRTLSRVCEALERGEHRLQREDHNTSNRVAWQYVSLVADRVLLLIFTIGTIAVTLGVLLHAPLSYYFIFGAPDNDGEDTASDERSPEMPVDNVPSPETP